MKSDTENVYAQLTRALQAGVDGPLSSTLCQAKAADIAEVFELLGDEERSRVLFALPPHMAAEVVVMLDEAVRGDVVDDMDTASLTEFVSELPPDDAADVLSELPREEVDQILGGMEDSQAEKIEGLLEYDEETAGGIMTPDVVAVPAAKTVADAVEHVRMASPDEDLHEIYIINDDRTLVGTVPLRRLVTSGGGTTLQGICDRDPVTVLAGDDQETVVQIIRKYDVPTAAVVDEAGRLLGRITHDDLLDVAEEEAAEDLYRMAGTDPAEFETKSVLHAARIRLTWLLPCMAGMMVTSTVLLVSKSQFDIGLFAALVTFAPMIGAMGGNSGIQISTVIVRGFATGEMASMKLLHVFWRESRIAIAMAPVCGVAAWLLVWVGLPVLSGMGFDVGGVSVATSLALSVGCAMVFAILMAGVLAISLPFMFRRLGIDPAIASGPLVTTLNDILCVSIYMLLAMMIAR